MNFSTGVTSGNVLPYKGTFSSMLPWREFNVRLVNITNKVADNMDDYEFAQSKVKTVRDASGRLTHFDAYA